MTKFAKIHPEAQPIAPTVSITSKAFADMMKLASNTEIPKDESMWFGVVHPGKNCYHISEIKVAPQMRNSASYVETDEEKMAEWLAENYPTVPERKKLRLHGHSHPNFSTTPSITDENLFKQLMADQSDYGIRIIVNKYGGFNLDVFNHEENYIYTELPLTIIMEDGNILYTAGDSYFIPQLKFKDAHLAYEMSMVDFEGDTAEMDAELKKMVKKTVVYSSSNYNNGYSKKAARRAKYKEAAEEKRYGAWWQKYGGSADNYNDADGIKKASEMTKQEIMDEYRGIDVNSLHDIEHKLLLKHELITDEELKAAAYYSKSWDQVSFVDVDKFEREMAA